MENWKKMYFVLCGGISDALELLLETKENRIVRGILIAALNDAEEVYMAEEDAAERTPSP